MIPLMKSTFLNEYETKKALAEFMFKADRLSMGEQCLKFEREFARMQGRKEAVFFNSGGSANLALIQSLKNMGQISSRSHIGFSAITWATNVMPIIQLGFYPIVLDCSPTTLNVMSENLLEGLAESSLDVLFITNALGLAGDLDRIKEICDAKGIILLEDNCEALGTELNSGKAGNFGLASTFSFFVAHHMSTIEGGMVCTDDESLGEMLRIVRSNGWGRNLSAVQQAKWRLKYNITSEFNAKYTFYDLGFNMRPTEISGFLGIQQMKYLEDSIKKREENYFRFEEIIRNNDDLIAFSREHIHRLSAFALPVLCKTPQLREKYFAQFSGAGVEIRPMISGNIQQQPFYQKYIKNNRNLPGADFIQSNGFYCGNYPELSEADIEIISSCLMRHA